MWKKPDTQTSKAHPPDKRHPTTNIDTHHLHPGDHTHPLLCMDACAEIRGKMEFQVVKQQQ